MSGLIGKKIGMTSVFSAEGKNIPCTVIEAGPCVVTQIKTVEKDGYEAVQIAYDDKSEKHTSKSLSGHFAKAGTTPKRKVAEFRDFHEVNLGDTITVDSIADGEWVDVTGISKGKAPWLCRCGRTDTRSAQPSAQTGFARCIFVSFEGVQRQEASRPGGRYAG